MAERDPGEYWRRVIATDSQGRITLFNQTAEELTGWTMEAAIGYPLETVFRIVDATSRKLVINPVTQALAERRVVQLPTSQLLLPRDDAEKAIAASGAPILDSQGELQGAVLIFRDVSESQRLEAQIRHAQKMQALGTLAGGIAHEFNNMLSAILGYTQLIAFHVGSNDDMTSYTDQIQTTVRRATELVQQILAFSRQGTSKIDILITDQTMPTLTGLELMHECRRLRLDLPVILCTGFSHTINEENALAQGVDAFMTKPVDLNSLAQQIEQVLNQRRHGKRP